MNVVQFPRRGLWKERNDLVPDQLIRLVAVLQVLGEPATSEEIVDMLSLCSLPANTEDVSALLNAHCFPQSEFDRYVVFRRVRLQGQDVWAFTEEFRNLLREHGLGPVLRALPLFAGIQQGVGVQCRTDVL